MADAAVRETDTDAAVSRLSAVKAGYLNDSFASYFVKRPASRPPLINIGTFVRTWAIDQLVHQFLDLDDGSKKQILSLGAGTDTRYFRLLSESGRKEKVKKYVEVDFEEATTKKAMILKKQNKLAELLGQDVRLENGGTSLISSTYSLISGDLRKFDELAPKLLDRLDRNLPTLVLAECCFIYLDPEHSSKILRWVSDAFSQAGVMLVLYDPVGLDDNFGKVMINNLQARGLQLLGAPANISLEGQIKRLQEHRFDKAFARDVKTIRKETLSATEQERISKLEMLDEIEELDLLTAHYSVSWAIKEPKSSALFQSVGI